METWEKLQRLEELYREKLEKTERRSNMLAKELAKCKAQLKESENELEELAWLPRVCPRCQEDLGKYI